ncbi:MAG: twin-arginine translocase subunit TatC [Candidatus Brocadiae bacterium]|nr:twin-arginine translocase subunit TatC [Candidatus Brocadiia bacterium]
MVDVETAAARTAGDHRMTFGEHLEELRQRLGYAVFGVILAVGFCLFWQEELMWVVSWPHRLAMESLGEDTRFQVFDYADRFMIPMKVSMIFGLALAAPVILWQMWKFIGAGLYAKERKYILIVGPASLILFFAGAAFGYFVLIPLTLKFLAGFGQEWKMFRTEIQLDKYLDLFFALTVAAGAVFEIPLIMTFLCFLGVVSPSTFASWRRFEIVAAAVLGAVLTPGGDLVSMASMAIPIILLYEIGILCGRLVYRAPDAA